MIIGCWSKKTKYFNPNFFLLNYYSHIVELRKPHREIFDFVLNDADLIPEETLFIDDNQENLIGAQKTGMNTLLNEPNADVYLRMKNYLNL